MKRLIYFATLLFFGFSLNAQTARISGIILDANTKKPVEYATVSLTDKTAGKTINGAISDNKGFFEIKNIPPGYYKINIAFIGYKPLLFDSLTVNDSKKTINLGTIQLPPLENSLKAVTVTANAPIVENKIDKIVYNAANDITSQGGAAIDVLKKVPQVTVDIDGNVDIQGNTNILFLINGKPSSIFGNSLADALASIPANQIKSIEVITSPGAKYDAQGTGGIINIILKENKVQGINGNLNLSAGTRLENTSLNLNYRHGNFGINYFFNGNAQLVSHTPSSQIHYLSDTVAHSLSTLFEDGYSDFQRNSYQSGISFNWDLTKTQNITASINYFHFSNINTGLTDQATTIYDQTGTYGPLLSTRNSDNRSLNNSVDWNLDYRKKFDKDGEELDILYNASFGSPLNTFVQSQTYSGQSMPYVGTSSNNPGTDQQNNISIDYSNPIGKDASFETGAKLSMQEINNTAAVSTLNTNTNQYLPDPNQSYTLNYNRNIYAVYASMSFHLFNFFDVKTGIRYEHTNTKIDFPNTTIPPEDDIVPSITLLHHLDKEQSIKFAYSHRIERPDYGEINPFINLSDPYNITTGNPLLLPELGNNFELGYSRNFKKGGNIYIALIERINSQDIKPVTLFYPSYQVGDTVYNDVSVANRQNIGTEYNSGITIYGSVPITSKLNIRGNFMALHRHVVSPVVAGSDVVGSRVRTNLNVSYQFSKDLVFEAFGNYNSPTLNLQGKTPQSLTYNFALRKQFWKKTASIGLTATNPFTEYVSQVSTIVSENYNSTITRQVPYRSFGISFSWKFGKLEFKKSKEEENNYRDELPSQ